MPRCSVVIVTYNSGSQVDACLHALASQDCEIIVVDNASRDDTTARLKAASQTIPLQLLINSRNLGFAAGVNLGARAAAGDVLLLLNPDAIARPGAISELLSCLEHTAAAGGALLEEDGQPSLGFVFRRLPELSSLLFEALLLNQIWPGNPVNRRYRCMDADYAREQTVEQPAGACLAVTRRAWEAVGGMDEQFFPVWFEDVDLCARLRSSGRTIVYCPTAQFHHSGAHSVGQMAFRDKQIFWYGNMMRYASKHFPLWKVMVLRVGIVCGMLLRVLAVLLGGKPKGVRLGNAVESYLRVVLLATGIGRPYHGQPT